MEAPLHCNTESPYTQLDNVQHFLFLVYFKKKKKKLTLSCLCVLVPQWHSEVVRLEQEAATLQESCKLFEVSSPDFRHLRLCQRQIFILKQLWDLLLCAQVIQSH